MNVSYNKSPYLVFNKDGSVSNLLTEKRFFPRDSDTVCNILKQLPSKPSKDELISMRLDIQYLLEKKIIFPSNIDPFTLYFIRYASIEIGSRCNSRCKFCPLSKYTLPSENMRDDIFKKIVFELKTLPELRWVSLNHYNEPSLDPNLAEKIIFLGRNSLKTRLFTNGKYLKSLFFTEEINKYVDRVVFNMPSVDPLRYLELTGARMPKGLLIEIEKIIKLGFPVEICVNGKKQAASQEKQLIDAYFKVDQYNNCHTYVNVTNSRSGLLFNEYINSNCKFSGKLAGCRRFFENIAISVSGDLFICCQDFFKHNVFGNIQKDRLKNILTSKEYIEMKKKICGEIPAEDQFICRYCNEILCNT